MSHPPHGAGPGSSRAARLASRPETAGGDLLAAGPARLVAAIAELAARVTELERVQLLGSADRPLSLAETAARIGRSPDTVARWTRHEPSRRARKLELLLFRDVSGRWVSTPRRIAKWQDAIAAAARGFIKGGARYRVDETDIVPTVRRRAMALMQSKVGETKAPSGGGAHSSKETSS